MKLHSILAVLALYILTGATSPAAEPERGPDYRPPADTLLIQAESMQIDGPGWQVQDYSAQAGYYGYPLGLKLLQGAPDQLGTATTTFTVPKDGTYRVWIRCLEIHPDNAPVAPYLITLTQNSREVGKAEFNDKTPRSAEEADKGEANPFVWWSIDVPLTRGPCALQMARIKEPAAPWGPRVDCLVITADLDFKPHAWCFAQPLYVRVVMGPKNKQGGEAFFSGHIGFPEEFCGSGYITKEGFLPPSCFDSDAKKFLQAADASPWVNLGPSLDPRGDNRMRFSILSPANANVPDSDFTIELSHSPTEPPFYRGHREGKGSDLNLVIDPRHPEATKSNIEWSALRLSQAEATPAPPNGKLPVRFPLLTGLNDYDTLDPEPAIKNDLLTLRALGFTGSTASYKNSEWLKAHGMLYAQYQEFSYGYVTNTLCQPNPAAMLAAYTEAIRDYYPETPHVLFFRLMDEIFSVTLDQMKTSPACTAKLRDYVRAKGLTPEELLGHAPAAGQDPWEDVKPTDDKFGSPRLYYYTQLVRAQILVDFFKTCTDVMRKVNPSAHTAANGSLELTYYFNGFMRGVDLFGLYKANALTYGFSEDASGAEPSAQTASLMMDFLRSACKYNHQPYGTYTLSQYPAWDDEAKAFDEIGHGVSLIHFYDYGPYHSDSSDPLSQRAAELFPAWKEFNFAVGSVEDDLLGSKVIPGRVALVYSLTSDIWSGVSHASPHDIHTGSGMERVNLYLLLKHLGYSIDILSEDDVLEGRANGYAALFTVESHFKDGVVEKLLDWVKQGGFLYAGAGSAQWDKYNEPTQGFAITGLKLGPSTYDWYLHYWPHNMPVVDQVSFDGNRVDAAAGKQPVAPDSAGKVVLNFADGTPCATQIAYGKGQLLYLGFYPGISYVRPANVKDLEREDAMAKSGEKPASYFATWFPEEYRQMMQSLLKPMGLKPPVQIDNYLVEGNLLEGKTGQVLALANWSGKKQTIHVSVDLPYAPGEPRAAIYSLREVKRQGNTVSFAIDLGPGNFVVLPRAK